jgi:hypothetical protein
MTITDYLLIGLCVLVVAVGVLLYYHHMAVMDNLAHLRKAIVSPQQFNQQQYNRPMDYPQPMRQMEMPVRPMEMVMPIRMPVEVPPNSPNKRDDSSSTESELQRQIEQYKRELEGVEDDLIYNEDEIEQEEIYLSTNDSDGSSVLNVEQEIDTVELENAESELGEKISQSNELRENINSEKKDSETQEGKVIEHIDDLENPSSQKDELMEKILNQEVKLESIGGEEESIITNNDNEQEIGILTKKFSNDQLKEFCRTHGLLIKGGKKEMSKRLLGCKEFREELMLKGEL